MTRKCPKCGEELSYLESSAKWSCWKCGEAFTLKDAGGIPPPPTPPEEEYSESGARIYRHEERKRAFEHALGNEEEIELISNHVEKHIGEISWVIHELVSDLVHVDILHVKPTRDQLLMSLRLGFSRALNATKSNDKQFIFLDEPFSSFDSGRRDAFIDFLRNFEKTFQQIFLISHIEGLENLVDDYIRIEKDGEGHSRVVASWED